MPLYDLRLFYMNGTSSFHLCESFLFPFGSWFFSLYKLYKFYLFVCYFCFSISFSLSLCRSFRSFFKGSLFLLQFSQVFTIRDAQIAFTLIEMQKGKHVSARLALRVCCCVYFFLLFFFGKMVIIWAMFAQCVYVQLQTKHRVFSQFTWNVCVRHCHMEVVRVEFNVFVLISL